MPPALAGRFLTTAPPGKAQKEEKFKKSKQSLRDLWDTKTWTNIHIVGVSEEKRKGQRYYWNKYHQRIPNLMKNMNINT